jgi:hypothetical protein
MMNVTKATEAVLLPQPPPELDSLPPTLVTRLAAEGVHSLEDWRALGRKRLQLFGITKRVIKQLDALARGTP